MNAIRNDYGLSARQQTIHHPAPTRFLLFLLLTTVGVVALSCRQDTRGQDTASIERNKQALSDSANQPKVNIEVNRRYDEKGNLIGFDSTYSSYYSNVQGDTLRMDSMMKSFDTYFDRHHASLFDRDFNKLFFNDSLRYRDFFHDDFFMKRYELNDLYLRDMMQRMDSIKNRFYRDAHKSPDPKSKT